jgi:ABC-type multidrug transport system ATPase subunit
LLEATDLAVTYRRSLGRRPLRALDGISLQVERGEVFALLGPNGSGKSTAMRCFLGLRKPDRGRVRLMGQAPEPGAALFARVAYLPEEPHYHGFLTVWEAVHYYAALYQVPEPERRAAEAIARVGLTEFEELRVARCSKGMKQKVGIAACLLSRPEILFLDEPTRGLDPVMVKELRDLLLELNRGGATVVLNSHVLSEVEAVATRFAILQRGRVVAEGDRATLMALDESTYVVELAGQGEPPPPFAVTERTANGFLGQVPAGRIGELFAAAAGSGHAVVRCALRQRTLEEVFLQAVSGHVDESAPRHG